jgi:hypothetical protein
MDWINIDIKERIGIYTNGFSQVDEVVPKTRLLGTQRGGDHPDNCLIMNVGQHVLGEYIPQVLNYWKTDIMKLASENCQDKYISLIYGDDTAAYNGLPTLSKVRILREPQNRVLTRFEKERHWGNVDPVRKLRNLSGFIEKKPIVHWRGSTTNSKQRNIAVSKYFNNKLCDIAFSAVCQNFKLDRPEHCRNNHQTIPQILENKYLLSIDGNDKASDINWKLASDSLVFMSSPKYESWLMESRLKPWVHYVPLEYNYSDLIDKYEWAESNPGKCLEMINNANLFMDSNFQDEKKEEEVERAVFKYYYDNVDIKLE